MLPRFHPAWLQFAARLDVYIIWLQDAFAAVAGLHRPGSLNVRLLLLIIAYQKIYQITAVLSMLKNRSGLKSSGFLMVYRFGKR